MSVINFIYNFSSEASSPCSPSPCADNAQCTEQNGIARCTCIPPYIGNPYTGGCKPECIINSDCASNMACLSQHCRNPCQGLCGTNTECSVVNHIPVCTCLPGYDGNPFTSCRQEPVTGRYLILIYIYITPRNLFFNNRFVL